MKLIKIHSGSALGKGCAANDGDCKLMAELMKNERMNIERKHKCSLEFQKYVRVSCHVKIQADLKKKIGSFLRKNCQLDCLISFSPPYLILHEILMLLMKPSCFPLQFSTYLVFSFFSILARSYHFS